MSCQTLRDLFSASSMLRQKDFQQVATRKAGAAALAPIAVIMDAEAGGDRFEVIGAGWPAPTWCARSSRSY
jgi:hypothetical protein